MLQADIVVIGGGIMGLSIARELSKRYPGASLIVLEKEPAVALHASGRNSGVLHAGLLLHGRQPQGALHPRRQPGAHRLLP